MNGCYGQIHFEYIIGYKIKNIYVQELYKLCPAHGFRAPSPRRTISIRIATDTSPLFLIFFFYFLDCDVLCVNYLFLFDIFYINATYNRLQNTIFIN